MIALQITDLKSFTSLLFLHDAFDAFQICEAVFSVAATYRIDGRRNRDFYDTDEWDALPNPEYLTWEETRPRCFEWIRGSKRPLRFKIVLRSPNTEKGMCFLNIHYDNSVLRCVTGFSTSAFSPDRADEREWDERIRLYFKKKGISFEET
ncbi:MAG: hypothetical protein HFI93_01360 [Lachnospiraceae bacterium]|nr:hypothetical protein [Lachnospiraceae bacterium]